ncbi:MAG TPA: DNA repair protein RadC, partial [Clostridiales bacterium]|nr:DNA repair protein RadC [Clostridiales bacterium]
MGKEKPVNTSIHAGHRNRVKERVKDNSIDKFSDHALLEILLFFAITRKDTNETAHKLINEFGSLEGVFKAPYDALLRVEG